MKKKTSTRKTHKRTRKQRGGNCGCNNTNPLFGTIKGGKSRKYKKYQKKQTPFYPRVRGGDALLGSSYNPISSFGTTSGIPFSSNTLFGNSNHASADGIADIPFFGKHNLPLV